MPRPGPRAVCASVCHMPVTNMSHASVSAKDLNTLTRAPSSQGTGRILKKEGGPKTGRTRCAESRWVSGLWLELPSSF